MTDLVHQLKTTPPSHLDPVLPEREVRKAARGAEDALRVPRRHKELVPSTNTCQDKSAADLCKNSLKILQHLGTGAPPASMTLLPNSGQAANSSSEADPTASKQTLGDHNG